ncbi:DASH complex subunit Duo1-domain-containing protein [Usnea florida]
MARSDTTPLELNSLSLSDSDDNDTEDLFASPSLPTKGRKGEQRPETLTPQHSANPSNPKEDDLAVHEASLRQELSSIRKMNQVISGVVNSLEKVKSNMETVSATVSNASNLLTTWTRILSQTEHNQRLILNPQWQGASQDVADGENELLLRRQEKERREAEEARREESRARDRDEAERRRMTEGPTTKGPRGRGRGGGRGVGRAGGNEYVGVGGQGGVRGTARAGGTVAGRTGSGIGRGIGTGRGRARGPS